jgi:hypothetical protein
MEFETMYCRGIVKQQNVGFYDLQIQGKIDDYVKDNKIYYIAAAGSDRRATFSGSGLPFANQIQAFDNTPNAGTVNLNNNGEFKINLITPNSYMVGLGSVLVPPTLFIEYIQQNEKKRVVSIKVSEPIPYRTLTYPVSPRPRIDASFYDNQFKLEVKTQEQILYDSQYPCSRKTYDDFWGLRYVN